MLYKLKIKELNKIQKNAMSKELIKEHYEWEDKRLFSYILGEVPKERELYRYSGKELSGEELEKNERKGLCVSDREKIMLVWAVLHLDSWHILPLLC